MKSDRWALGPDDHQFAENYRIIQNISLLSSFPRLKANACGWRTGQDKTDVNLISLLGICPKKHSHQGPKTHMQGYTLHNYLQQFKKKNLTNPLTEDELTIMEQPGVPVVAQQVKDPILSP